MSREASYAFKVGAFMAGYLAASIASAMAYTFFVALSAQAIGIAEPSDFTVPEHIRMLVGFTIFVGLFVVSTSFLPAIAAFLLLRFAGLRDVLSHMAAGAAVSAASVVITARYIPFMNELTLDWAIAAAGAVGGAAFWLVWSRLVPATSPAP